MNNFLSAKNIPIEDIVNYFKLCSYFKALKKGTILSTLKDKTISIVFYENSTRTKVAFTRAAQKLGASVIDLSTSQSSVQKGETLIDTLQTLEALETDAFIIRHPDNDIYKSILPNINIPVINGGNGTDQHPSQALYDAFTMFECFVEDKSKTITKELLVSTFRGKKIAITGDLLHSRVANSNYDILSTLGASILFCSPTELKPRYKVETWGSQFDNVLSKKPDAVMMLRIQKERMKEAQIPNNKIYFEKYGLNDDRLKKLNKDTIILHPGPVNRGIEISNNATDSKQSMILNQVHNALFMRMAIVYRVFLPNKFPY